LLTKKEKKELKRKYYSKADVTQVLGCLLQDTDLIDAREYKLTPEDFIEPFHSYIYKSIYNMHIDGLNDITATTIKDYLDRVSESGARIVFEINNGLEVISTMAKFSKMDNFSYHYNRIKKFSLLRDMIDDNVDINNILDKSRTLDKKVIREQEEEFDKWSLDDIIMETIEYKSMKYRENYNVDEEIEYSEAGENIEDILEVFRQGDTYGLLTNEEYSNSITLGNKRKTVELLSGGSGGGKSRRLIGKMVYLTAPEIWSREENRFIINSNNPENKLSSVYIGSELDINFEVKPIILATISGVETVDIKNYDNLTDEQKDRIEYAKKIMEKTKLHLYSLENYDMRTMERLVKKHQHNEDVYGLYFDYIEKTGNIIKEFKEIYSTQFVPSHELFLYVSKSLKERLAKKLNIFVMSSTQLNATSTTREHKVGASMFRGSFAVMDKADIASIVLVPSKEEMKIYEEYVVTQKGFSTELIRPNAIKHLFKNRNGVLVEIKIFQYVNLGNLDIRDLLVTDYNNMVIKVDRVKAEIIDIE